MRSLLNLLLSSSALLCQGSVAQDQVAPATLQSVGFNSSFSLTKSQIEAANLTEPAITSLNNIGRFERSQLANGGPSNDDFYSLPPLTNTSGSLQPGMLLKVQFDTDTTSFALAPNTALSRIMYTTTDFNGTVVPATGFVLWPFLPKQFPGSKVLGNVTHKKRAPALLWAHGTSGFFASAAPSSFRSLWYSYNGLFQMAQAGYAVVAPDYAGLGLTKSWDNTSIPHQYLVSPAGAHDMLYAMQAALKAFPDLLDPHFVAIGHSQGGGVAWGVAEALAKNPGLGPGYLGTIAGSPTTDAFSADPRFIGVFTSFAVKSIFPNFDFSDWFTPAGIARIRLFKEIQGSPATDQQLFFSTPGLLKPDLLQTWFAKAYGMIANAGRKKLKGPMLVIQGTEDIFVGYNVTTKTVQDTCAMFPGSDLEYLVANGTGHVPTFDLTQPIWFKWIEDRFMGSPVAQKGCKRTNLDSFLPIKQYHAIGNSFLQWAGAADFVYEALLGF